MLREIAENPRATSQTSHSMLFMIVQLSRERCVSYLEELPGENLVSLKITWQPGLDL